MSGDGLGTREAPKRNQRSWSGTKSHSIVNWVQICGLEDRKRFYKRLEKGLAACSLGWIGVSVVRFLAPGKRGKALGTWPCSTHQQR